jgi:trk system potassium uptake protein TrkH
MNVLPVLLVVGTVLLGMAFLMLIPAALGTLWGEASAVAFFQSAAFTASVGLLGVGIGARTRVAIYPKQTFVITGCAWLGMGLFGAIPFGLFGGLSATDALFEAMSGITATGATVIVGLDELPRSVLLWRSMLQAAGGLGFAVMAIVVLPFLGVGGMRLFRSESSEWSDKAAPRMRTLALLIAGVYFTLMTSCALAYHLAGMSAFDAANHAMTTVSTAGFSTHDLSFAHFGNPTIEWIGVVFMLSGALPFALYVRALGDRGRALVTDQQVRGFLGFVTALILIVAAWRWLSGQAGPHDALRSSAFNLISIVTTTGYASSDYASWGAFATMVFFYVMFLGGCSGSTTGGFKAFRLQIAAQFVRNQIQRQIHPNGVFVVSYNRRPLADDVMRSLIGFSMVFFATIAAIAVGLAIHDLDFLTSMTGAISAVCNVGPGLGPVIGPTGTFASLPDTAKWLLAAGMLLGRLEIMTIVVLFSRRFWQS